jgi:hypothetical protein
MGRQYSEFNVNSHSPNLSCIFEGFNTYGCLIFSALAVNQALLLSPRGGRRASSGCGTRKGGLQIRRVAANILNKQSQTADKGWFSRFRGEREANNSR